jgi:TolB-like protein
LCGTLNTSDRQGIEPPTESTKWKWAVPATTLVIISIAVFSCVYFRGTGTEVAPGVTASEKPSLAVLPFINESGDEEIDYLASGLTESADRPSLRRSLFEGSPLFQTVSRYKGSELTAEAIGQDLKVPSCSTDASSNEVRTLRLFLSLVNVESGYQIWGKQYERDVGSLAQLQGEILRDVSE